MSYHTIPQIQMKKKSLLFYFVVSSTIAIALQNDSGNLVREAVEVTVGSGGDNSPAERHGVDGHAGELRVEVVRRLRPLPLVAARVERRGDALRQEGGPVEAPEELVVHHLCGEMRSCDKSKRSDCWLINWLIGWLVG